VDRAREPLIRRSQLALGAKMWRGRKRFDRGPHALAAAEVVQRVGSPGRSQIAQRLSLDIALTAMAKVRILCLRARLAAMAPVGP